MLISRGVKNIAIAQFFIIRAYSSKYYNFRLTKWSHYSVTPSRKTLIAAELNYLPFDLMITIDKCLCIKTLNAIQFVLALTHSTKNVNKVC